MKLLLLLVSIGTVICRPSGVLPVHPGVGGLYKGPNSETIIKGPDGSVITAEQIGGAVVTEQKLDPIVVAEPVAVEPLVAAHVPVAAPVPVSLSHTSIISESVNPVVVPVAPVHSSDVHVIETELVDAPDVEPNQSSDLVGPSGSISTRGSESIVSGPASTTISKSVKKVPIVSPIVPVASIVNTPVLAPVSIAASPLPSTIGAVTTLASPVASVTPIHVGLSSTVSPIQTEHIDVQQIVLPSSSNEVVSSTAAPLHIGSSVAPLNLAAIELNNRQVNDLSARANLAVIEANNRAKADINNHLNAQAAAAEAHTLRIGLKQEVEAAAQAVNHARLNNAANIAAIEAANRQSEAIRQQAAAVAAANAHLSIPEQRGIPLQQQLNQAYGINHQLTVDPLLIPQHNIIPPEIGLAKGQVSVAEPVLANSVPLAPGISSATISTPISAKDNLIVGANQLLAKPVITQTNPIPRGHPILGPGLSRYGLDPNQINLTNVPLSNVIPYQPNLHVTGPVDDISLAVANRYGRGAKGKA